MKRTKTPSRLLSLAVAALLLLALLPATLLAAEGGTDSAWEATCAHLHDEECGGIEDENLCTHECDEECGGLPPQNSEDADGKPTDEPTGEGAEEPGQAVVEITAFDELAEEIQWQGFDAGEVGPADIVLPETLAATGGAADAPAEEHAALTAEGVVWQCVNAETGEPAEFDGEAEGTYTFAPTLPDGYTLAEGVALPLVTVIVRPAGPAFAPASLPDVLGQDLAEGDTWVGEGKKVTFGGMVWRVLEVYESNGTDGNTSGNLTAFLLADELLPETRRFHSTNNSGDGNWVKSDLRAWLNNAFLYGTFDADERAAILQTPYTLGGNYDYTAYDYGKGTEDISPIFLLSTDEAGNSSYFADNADRTISSHRWWLRSPGDLSHDAALVDVYGAVYAYGISVSHYYGIRPALKINLSSDIFTSYALTVTVKDGQGQEVAGARVSLAPLAAQAAGEKFTDTNGTATLYAEGVYILTVSKAGYAVYTRNINVTADEAIEVTLVEDDSLPATVYLGKNVVGSGKPPMAWQVLDVDNSDPANPRALLLLDSYLGDHSHTTWGNVDAWINGTGSGYLGGSYSGFLEPGSYFTTDEIAAMENYSETDTKMFLLSEIEVRHYLPDTSLYAFGDSWWTRSSSGISGTYRRVRAAPSDNGNYYIDDQSSNGTARPAVWVDLNKLCQLVDTDGTVKLVPQETYAGTITVQDRGNNLKQGANVTVTPLGTYSEWDGTAMTTPGGSDTTNASGEASFVLLPGSYTASASLGNQKGSANFTVDANGVVGGPVNITLYTSQNGLAEGGTVYFGSTGAYTTGNQDFNTPVAGPGQEWVVLEIANGEIWLFAADVLFESGNVMWRQFHSSNNTPGEGGTYANQWSTSDLHHWLNGAYLADAFTDCEQAAVNSTEHDTELERNNSWGVPAGTENHLSQIFLLDLADVQSGGVADDSALRAASTYWWLRSPGSNSSSAALVSSNGAVFALGRDVHLSYGIRPALKINLSSVIFTSAAEGGKSSVGVGDGLVAAPAATGAAKITLLAQDITLDVLGINNAGTAAASLTIAYNAETATVGTGHYVSCVLVSETTGEIAYYAKLEDLASAAGGSVTVPLTGVADGDYTLRLFNEQANGDYETDYASQPYDVKITVTNGGGQMAEPKAPYVGSIEPPVAVIGDALTLTPPTVLANGAAITSEGWQISADGTSGWADFNTATLMDASHNSQYLRYVATNSEGTATSNVVQITVLPKPTVASVEPSGGSKPVDGSIIITFSEEMDTAATGSISLNGTALTSTGTWNTPSNKIYTIPYSGLSYGTAYTVAVSGFQSAQGVEMDTDTNAGSFTTEPLVNAATPNFTTHPQDANYVQGDAADDLTVTATSPDGGNLTYQWYTATDALGAGAQPISSANTASYTPPTNTPGTYYYFVRVINTNNSVNGTKTATADSNVATLIVDELVNAAPPSITAHPQDASYVQGDAADDLTVTATSPDGGNLTYQWYRAVDTTGTGAQPISGANTASYTPPTNTPGTYYYFVRVTNTNNSVNGTKTATADSNVAEIEIEPPPGTPLVGNISAPGYVYVGQTLTLITPTVQQDGAVVTSEGWEISVNQATWTPFDPTTPMTVQHNGQYLRYFATSAAGTGHSNEVQLNILMPSLTVTGPTSATASVGDPFSVNVGYSYEGPHDLTFTLTGDALPNGLDFDPATGTISGTPAAGTEQDYNLTITVKENGGSSPLEQAISFTLTVQSAPVEGKLTISGVDDAVFVGSRYEKRMTVSYNGAETLEYSATGLPAGVTIDPASGLISGTPTKAGTYKVQVTVAEQNGTLRATAGYTLVVEALATEKPAITLAGLPTNNTVQVGDNFTLTPSEDGQTGSSGWSWDSDFFSATFNSPATFTALKAGTSTITYTAPDGRTASVTITIHAATDASKPDTSGNGAIAGTGDQARTGLYIILATLAVAGLCGGGLLWRKRRRAQR